MTSDKESDCIAACLATLWIESKQPGFASYVRSFHGVEVTHLPHFHCLFIGETQDGDFKSGPGSEIKHWWQVDEQDIRKVATPKMEWDYNSPFAPFFPTPLILFYWEHDRVVVCERLGQRMICWKLGRLIRATDELQVADLQPLIER